MKNNEMLELFEKKTFESRPVLKQISREINLVSKLFKTNLKLKVHKKINVRNFRYFLGLY